MALAVGAFEGAVAAARGAVGRPAGHRGTNQV